MIVADSATMYPERVDVASTLRSEARIGKRTKKKLFLVGHPFVYEILFRNMGTKAIPGYKQPPWQLLVHLDWANGSTQLIPHDMTKEILPGDAVLIRGFTLVRAPGVFYVKVGYPFHKRWEDEDKKRQSLQHGEEIVWVGTRVAIDEATYLQRRNLRVTAVGIVATVVATLVAIFLLR